jgi:hypothetical protein
MKRFIAALAVVSISAIAGEPSVTTGTAPAEKKTVSTTGALLRGTGTGLGTRGTGTGLGTGSSTKPAKAKVMTTAPVGTK